MVTTSLGSPSCTGDSSLRQDDHWGHIQDARERKKVQNRIAQRNHRERARKRIEAQEQLCRPDEQPKSSRAGRRKSAARTPSSANPRRWQCPNCGSSAGATPGSGSAEAGTSEPATSVTCHKSSEAPPDLFPKAVSADGAVIDIYQTAGAARWDVGVCHSMAPNEAATSNIGVVTSDGSCISMAEESNSDIDMSVFDFMVPKVPIIEEHITVQGKYCHAGKTALHIAAENGKLSILRMLLQSNANALAQDHMGRTALHLAVERGHEEVVCEILRIPGTATIQARNGESPLHSAVSAGNEKIVSLLVAAGSTVESKDANGQTALHLAALSGNENILKSLIHTGADVNARIEL